MWFWSPVGTGRNGTNRAEVWLHVFCSLFSVRQTFGHGSLTSHPDAVAVPWRRGKTNTAVMRSDRRVKGLSSTSRQTPQSFPKPNLAEYQPYKSKLDLVHLRNDEIHSVMNADTGPSSRSSSLRTDLLHGRRQLLTADFEGCSDPRGYSHAKC